MARFPQAGRSRYRTLPAGRKEHMLISAEALVALSGLEHGARYNALHSTARELMAAGLACDNFGALDLTEAGRIYLRRGKYNIAITSDEHVHDMSVHMMQIPDAAIDRAPNKFWRNHVTGPDPMTAPHLVNKQVEQLVLAPEAPAEPLPIAETRKQEMLRAAGVASGITGVWVEDRWVEEFVRALDGVNT